MGERKVLSQESLATLFEKLRAAGTRIVAPRKRGEQVLFEQVSSPGELCLESIQSTVSAKETVFPRYEELFRYELGSKDIKLQDAKEEPVPTLLFGIRPCDARSFAVLNSVFTWDSHDRFFEQRLQRLTVVSIACTQADDFCFCTSVGGGPGDTQGSDIQLTPLGGGRYLAEILSEKGQAVVAAAPEAFAAAANEKKEEHLADVPVRFDLGKLTAGLPGLFGKEELWIEQSLRCLGCGACAFVCPTCVCFDIQDEPAKRQCGKRVRCWDSCGFSLFTLHTSGHNPRSRQSARWRQRVMHKFSYFQERLGYLGCVGCGRCSRSCPADMNLAEHLKKLAEVAP